MKGRTAALVFGLCVLAGTGGCDNDEAGTHAGALDHIRQTGVIRVVTRNAPTSYYLDRHAEPAGPEQAMVAAFARSLDVTVDYVVVDSIAATLDTLARGDADLAAAGLSVTPARRARFLFGPGYQQVQQQVVCNRKLARPERVADLAGVSLTVIADSSYEERLKTLGQTEPALSWTSDEKVGTEQLLRRIWQGGLACTVADSNIVAINRRYYPTLDVRFSLGAADTLAWALPKTATALKHRLDDWFAAYRADGGLDAVQSRYYDDFPAFDFVDKRTLVRRIGARYPRYAPLFRDAARAEQLPPLLLSAQSYQESHWDPQARSPTGVRGLMMLTRNTARSVGVSNRLDPAQSIRGGARYLARMRERLDADMARRDRMLMALAAYNIGFAHLRDARRLTRRLGKNPDRWRDVRAVLPLLADKRYYPSLQFGYARGSEPVRYVRRIRDYEDVIRQHVE